MVKSLHFTIGNIGSIPGWRTKILHAPSTGQKKKKREREKRKRMERPRKKGDSCVSGWGEKCRWVFSGRGRLRERDSK